MKPEWKAKILAYNKAVAEKKSKADDLDEMLEYLYKVYRLLEHLIPEEVKAIFEKYGYREEKK